MTAVHPADLREGDVLSWHPEHQYSREGVAVVQARRDGTLVVVDTHWHFNRYALTERDLDTATVEWNLNDFIPVNEHDDSWHDLAEDDRRVLPSQHGAVSIRFARLGATASPAVVIARAEARVTAARADLTAAQDRLSAAEADLVRMRAELGR